MTRRPIPDDVADAFGEALVLLVQWKRGAEEPTAVLDGKTIRIGLIFELVRGRAFKDKVPGSMLELLRTYASREPERKHEFARLTLDPTYDTAARCLLKWVDEKQTKSRGP
jgi:hypothetical protein